MRVFKVLEGAMETWLPHINPHLSRLRFIDFLILFF